MNTPMADMRIRMDTQEYSGPQVLGTFLLEALKSTNGDGFFLTGDGIGTTQAISVCSSVGDPTADIVAGITVDGFSGKAFQLTGNGGVAALSATTGTIAVSMPNDLSVVRTVTPTGACTLNVSGGYAGARCSLIITTSGTSSYNITFGTNFKSQGVLATGTVDAKVFSVTFVCKDGTTWVEQGRTTAM